MLKNRNFKRCIITGITGSGGSYLADHIRKMLRKTEEGIKGYLTPGALFEEFGLRYIGPVDGHNIDAEIIGRVFASLVCSENKNNIVVCMDGRLSSPKLSHSLVKGLKYSGANIIDIGIGPTPMLYFSSHHFNAVGAIMITG